MHFGREGSIVNRTILIVEDEPSIVTLLQYNLEKHHFNTVIAYDGEEALQRFNEREYALIVLDIMLPKLDGVSVCTSIRSKDQQVPIIMLTAKNTEHDKVRGLELGADDYLTKPFSPKELIARIHAILRRTEDGKTNQSSEMKNGDLVINPQNYEVKFKEELIDVTKKEFELLVYFMQHKGKTITREILLRSVWNFDFVGDSRMIDVQISNLREKIEENKRSPQYIKTVRGLGYKMEDYT